MSDLHNVIMRDIEEDPSIDSTEIAVEIQAKGFIKKKKTIHLTGSVKSEAEKKKVMQIAEHFAGDNYDVVNDLMVKS